MIPTRHVGRRRAGGLLLLALAACAFASMAAAATGPKFPALTGRVVDDAQVLSAGSEVRLTQELAQLEAQTGHQLVVVTVTDLQGYEIEDYGYQLGRAWQLGRKGVNDGAILLVAPKEKKVRIEVGYGLEPVLTDALSSVILQTRVLPRFRQGRMEQGVVDGAEAVIAQVSLPEEQAKANVAKASQQAASPPDDVRHHIPILLIVLLVFWVLSAVLRGGGRGRSGIGGLWPLLFLGGGGGGRGDGWGGGFGGGGGFSGGGGSFGGGGSSGSW